jgi:uncharacterized protein (DUF1499 family)
MANQANDEKSFPLHPAQVRDAVRRALSRLKWQPRPAGADGFAGVWTSPVFRFKDDISVKLAPGKNETKVIVRSVSRLGFYDFGQNARHVRSFFAALEEKLGK